MIIGDRLRALREEKKLSQGDIEKRTGLLRCYISRVENGHTVPAIETLEKMARALEVPLYQLFYDGEEAPELPNLPKRRTAEEIAWGSYGQRSAFSDHVPQAAGPHRRRRPAFAAVYGSEDGKPLTSTAARPRRTLPKFLSAKPLPDGEVRPVWTEVPP